MATEVTYGIDVSHHNGVVNWPLVATQCRYGFAKATEGTGWKDPQFDRNYQGIRDAGLIRGAYAFARPSKRAGGSESAIVKDAEAEANWYLEVVGTDRKRTFPAVLYLEWSKRSRGIKTEELIEWALTWLERVERVTGSIPILYTGRNYWRYRLGSTNALMRFHLWLAQYKRSAQGVGPKYPIGAWPWMFWQYSSKKIVQGVDTPCDANIFAGTSRELERFVAEAPYQIRQTLPQYHHADPILWDRLVCWAVESFSDRPA